MATLKPFPVIHPDRAHAASVCAPPYDVLDRSEALRIAEDNPNSFLHITRSEIDLPERADPYSDAVYALASDNLKRWIASDILKQEPGDCYMIYRQIADRRSQTGVVGLVSVSDYENDVIKKHELTREDKQRDRTMHIEACNAHTEPVLLTYRSCHMIDVTVKKWISEHEPLFDFQGKDGTVHQMWNVDEPGAIEVLEIGFESVPHLYIADGHHRAASAVAVASNRRQTGSAGRAEYFPAVCFPSFDLKIMDYNRTVSDLYGLTGKAFQNALTAAGFRVREAKTPMRKPDKKGTFGMYIDGCWYILDQAKPMLTGDPIEDLDVSILQNRILGPILGIKDPRTDHRIGFAGGILGLSALKKQVDTNQAAVAFALCPLSMDELLAAADAGRTMPPKSTWFEPKLASGLIVHTIGE